MADPRTARRSFLATLSAFVATPAAIAAAPAIAAKVEPGSVEAPELLELGEKLRSHLATYREAAARLAAAREHYERIKPALPADLIVPTGRARPGLGELGLSSMESDIDGKVLSSRHIYDRRSLQAHIIVQDVSRTTKEGRRLRRLARLAKAYEAAKEAAAREAGYWEADAAAGDAARRIMDLTHRLLQAEPVTPAGARVYAEAILALAEAQERLYGEWHTQTAALGAHLAAAHLRIFGGTT